MSLAGSGGTGPPLAEIFVHPEHSLPGEFDLGRIAAICVPALVEVLAVAKAGAPLLALEEIEITLVSDTVIADVHVEFMGIAGATDVITFDHGEILISTDTAALQGLENGHSVERETALYVVHGLLHLAGYADKTAVEFEEMARLQGDLLARVWGD